LTRPLYGRPGMESLAADLMVTRPGTERALPELHKMLCRFGMICYGISVGLVMIHWAMVAI